MTFVFVLSAWALFGFYFCTKSLFLRIIIPLLILLFELLIAPLRFFQMVFVTWAEDLDKELSRMTKKS